MANFTDKKSEENIFLTFKLSVQNYSVKVSEL